MQLVQNDRLAWSYTRHPALTSGKLGYVFTSYGTASRFGNVVRMKKQLSGMARRRAFQSTSSNKGGEREKSDQVLRPG
jgi:hypothetical protein